MGIALGRSAWRRRTVAIRAAELRHLARWHETALGLGWRRRRRLRLRLGDSRCRDWRKIAAEEIVGPASGHGDTDAVLGHADMMRSGAHNTHPFECDMSTSANAEHDPAHHRQPGHKMGEQRDKECGGPPSGG